MDLKKSLAIATGVLSLVATAGGAIWAIDDRMEDKVRVVELKTVQTFEQFNDKINLRFKMQQSDILEDKIFRYELLLQERNDPKLINKIKELQEKKKIIDREIEKLLES